MLQNILQDVKIILNEKTAFTKLEEVWNQEEDKKKKEEEELAAKRKEEMANNTDQTYELTIPSYLAVMILKYNH